LYGASADRYHPVPPPTLTLAHNRMAPAQGEQRVHVTIPVTAGVNALGESISYRWDTHVDGGRELAAICAGQTARL
jgi:hypothetical protein